MKINLLDGSLMLLGGHPHDIDLRVTRALVEAGHDVHVYSHLRASEILKSHYAGIAPVTPLFSIDPYAPPASFDAASGDILKNLEGAKVTATELLKTRKADIELWPSFYPHQLLACTLAKTTAMVSGCIHHPPDFFSPGDTAWWRYALLQAYHVKMHLRLGAIEPETRYPYLPLTMNGQFSLLPFPADAVIPDEPRKTLKTMGIFGFQRKEKGSTFLQPLIQQLVNDGYHIILHDSNPVDNGMRDMKGVTCLGHVMNLEDEIAKCDLVIAPYKAEAYKYRGSGIVMSALAHGIPVVAPSGSAPGRLIEKTGAGTLFTHPLVESIYAAIQTAIQHYPAIAESACNASRQWPEQHGVSRFVNAMIQ